LPASHIAYFRAVASRWYRHAFDARWVEAFSGADLNLSRPTSRIKAATPFPLVDIDRAAGAARDRADMDIAVIDVPAVGTFWDSVGE
jgi:hypothetical protein